MTRINLQIDDKFAQILKTLKKDYQLKRIPRTNLKTKPQITLKLLLKY